MKDPVLEDIVRYTINKLKNAYGYCGAAMADEMAMLNSDDKKGNDIKITITIKPE